MGYMFLQNYPPPPSQKKYNTNSVYLCACMGGGHAQFCVHVHVMFACVAFNCKALT